MHNWLDDILKKCKDFTWVTKDDMLENFFENKDLFNLNL